MDKSADISALVEEHISDGDTVFVGGFGHCVPFALGFEIIRQGRKDLTLCRSGTDILFDIMIGAGAASKVVFGYLGNPGIGLGHAFRRAVEAGTLAYEDWTKDELYDRAREIGIEGRSDMTKDELIAALRRH